MPKNTLLNINKVQSLHLLLSPNPTHKKKTIPCQHWHHISAWEAPWLGFSYPNQTVHRTANADSLAPLPKSIIKKSSINCIETLKEENFEPTKGVPISWDFGRYPHGRWPYLAISACTCRPTTCYLTTGEVCGKAMETRVSSSSSSSPRTQQLLLSETSLLTNRTLFLV